MKTIKLFVLLLTTLNCFAQYQFTNYTTFNTGSNSLGSNTIYSMAENPINQHLIFTSYDVLMEYNNVDFSPRYDIFDPLWLYNFIEYIFFDIDNQGNLWFENFDTLRKFDGVNTLQYILPPNPTNQTSIFCDSQGNVWIGTPSVGLYKYDGTSLTTYHSGNGLVSDYIKRIFEDSQGNIWVSTGHGISMYDGTTWISYSAGTGFQWSNGNSTVSCIGQDANGTIWASGFGIAYLSGSTWTFLEPSTLLNAPVTDYNVWVIVSDTINDRLWFGTTAEGLFYKEGSNWYKHTVDEGLPTNHVTCGMLDSQGRVWFGLLSGGLCKYEDSTWTYFSTGTGLSENWINDIHESVDHEIWTANAEGVSRFDLFQWTSYFTDIENVQHKFVKSDFDNHVCMFDNNHIYRYGNNSWDTIYHYSVGGGGMDMLSESSDDYWTAGNAGVAHFNGPDFWNPANWIGYQTGLPHNFCYTLEKDSSGTLWVGTHNGIAYLQGSTWIPYAIPNDDFGNRIFALRNDFLGNLWICSDYGAACKSDTGWVFYFETSGLANNHVWDVEIATDSTIWLATAGGVTVISDTGMYSIKEADGLVDRQARCLEEDHEGNMWIGTQHGISKLHNAVPILEKNEVKTINGIKVFPNPVKNNITISAPTEIIKIELYSPTGQLLRKINSHKKQETVDISGSPPGNYFIRAIGKEDVWVKKFVVVR